MARAFGPFRADGAGIRSIFHGTGMRAALRGAADSVADSCNAVAEPYIKEKTKVRELSVTPYVAQVKSGRGTLFAVVSARGLCPPFERRHHWLASHNH